MTSAGENQSTRGGNFSIDDAFESDEEDPIRVYGATTDRTPFREKRPDDVKVEVEEPNEQVSMFTARKRSYGKVMFLHLSVISFSPQGYLPPAPPSQKKKRRPLKLTKKIDKRPPRRACSNDTTNILVSILYVHLVSTSSHVLIIIVMLQCTLQ